MKNEAIQETSKMYFFAEQVREFVNPKYKESSHTTGQTLRQLVIDWEKLRRQFDGFAFVWNMKKGNQKIINRQWRGRLDVFVFALKICPRRLKGFVIPLEFKNHKSTMKWKERKSSKKEAGGQLCLSIWSKIWQKSSVKKEKQERRTHKGSQKVQWICRCIGNVKSGCFGLDVFVFSFGNAKSGWDGEGSSVNHKLAIIDPGSQSFSLHWKLKRDGFVFEKETNN